MPLVFTLFDMEQNGIRVEADALKQYGDQLAGKIAELEKEIYEEAGETFNINSPKQLGVVLFENMEAPGRAQDKDRLFDCGGCAGQAGTGSSGRRKEYWNTVSYTKLKSTYADGLAGYIQEDGRIHGKFHQTSDGNRDVSSSAEPNLQNISGQSGTWTV